MVFTKHSVFFSILIIFIYFWPLDAQQCNRCEIRNFSQKSEASCICPENQYCNVSNFKCNKCDKCYDGWASIVKKDKADIEKILREFLKKYEVNLDDLKKLLKTLTDGIERSKNELKNLKTQNDQVGKKIPEVNDDLQKLKKDIREIEEKLKRIGEPQSVQDVISFLKKVITIMKNIAEKLKQLHFDYDDIKPLEINKLKDIDKQIKNMNRNFPKIERNSLNLATSLESDIDLLEAIISKFGGNETDANKFSGKNIKENTKWIERDLLWLFSLLNSFGNVSFDVEGLQKNASNVRSSAEMMDSKLTELLKNHENFEKRLNHLKNETQFYIELQNLLKRMQSLNIGINKLDNLLKIWRRKAELSRELDEFLKERDQFDAKERNLSKYKPKLDKLYQEKKELLEKYNDNVRPKNEITKEISNMRKEISEIRSNVTKHCSSGIPRKT